ncbi:MAG: hypothetical protein C4554_07715 [Dethiobacter sp.]|jgi:DNA replication protein DnaC|nr:MAG: hypothetical protein C4554_07715 [Dethiobacter sp.]
MALSANIDVVRLAACRQGLKTKYYRVNRLLTDLAIGRGDGSYNKIMRDLKKTDLLILDDWGMTVLDPASGRDLLEVVEVPVWLLLNHHLRTTPRQRLA